MSITGDSPIDVLVTDPLGRVVGGNTTNNFNEIPGATYSGLGTEPQKITIPNPIPGAYSIKVIGTGVGPYHMKLQTISDVGSVVGTQDFQWAGECREQQFLHSWVGPFRCRHPR